MKYTWIMLVVVGLTVVMLAVKGLGAFVHTEIRTANATVALTNAAADVGAIDVYVDHQLVLHHLAANDPADYLQLTPGNHLIDVVPAGANVVLIKTTELTFAAGHTYQLTLAGLQADWSVALAFADETTR